MKIDKTEVYGFDAAMRGMRNPLNSWDKSDSFSCMNCNDELMECECHECKYINTDYVIGENDMKLAQKLILAGTEHSKFMRFITVWADIDLPLYVWKEFDTYKFVEKNSTSTMHKITSKPLTPEDFEWEELNMHRKYVLNHLNSLITEFKNEQIVEIKKLLFEEIIQDLPSAFIQKRTIVTNYQELRNIYFQRKNHKLDEWHKVCEWIEKLPYAKELICIER